MADRHIRRYCADYTQALANLLPFGLAWPRYPDSLPMIVTHGLSCIWEFVDGRAADLLERESDPRTTMELLPDWERNWGLPDPCYQEPLTIGDRQKALVQRMTIIGAQSRQFFIDTAAFIGYTITINEYRPFMVGLDRCGDNRVYGNGTAPYYNKTFVLGYLPVYNPIGVPVANGELSEWPNYGLGPDINRYYWTVHVQHARLTWFRLGGGGGQTGVDPHLLIGLATDLECLLNRWKPGHTQIIFDYSGLQTGGSMAGTP
jgi:uncharacterized protein YmfQ (DUF2313 family)